MFEKWPKPIYAEDGTHRCPICTDEPMVRPVQIQCGHVLCNGCIQNIMALDENTTRCPVCRSELYEYRSLCSNRIRRPRDKSVQFDHEAGIPPESADPDYEPPSGIENRPEERPISQATTIIYTQQSIDDAGNDLLPASSMDRSQNNESEDIILEYEEFNTIEAHRGRGRNISGMAHR